MMLKLKPGEFVTIKLPSGTEINIEATADTASVVTEDQVLYNEDYQYCRDGSPDWQQTWPVQQDNHYDKDSGSEYWIELGHVDGENKFIVYSRNLNSQDEDDERQVASFSTRQEAMDYIDKTYEMSDIIPN